MVAVWRGYVKVFCMRTKAEASQCTKDFVLFIARQATISVHLIKTIRSDGGGEYDNGDLRRFIADEGLRFQHTAPHRSTQNGVAPFKR